MPCGSADDIPELNGRTVGTHSATKNLKPFISKLRELGTSDKVRYVQPKAHTLANTIDADCYGRFWVPAPTTSVNEPATDRALPPAQAGRVITPHAEGFPMVDVLPLSPNASTPR